MTSALPSSSFFSQTETAAETAPEWHDEVDVIIVGLGAAGVAAAIEAREAGLEVLVLDRFGGGGATNASGGVVYAGGGTAVQKQVGEDDSIDDMFAYLRTEVGPLVSDAHLRRFCEESAPTIDWLIDRHVKFGDTIFREKTSYPAAEYFLYHSDNSLVDSYKKAAKPAARGHRGWVPLEQGRKAIGLGVSIFEPLRAHAETIGVRMENFTPVTQLVHENGRVSGVKAHFFTDETKRTHYQKLLQKAEKLKTAWPPILPGYGYFMRRSKEMMRRAAQLEAGRDARHIKARRGVVLAAGGFAFNSKMMAHYAPAYRRGYALGTDGDNGAGIELGQSVGGHIANMSRASAWRFINPPFSFALGMMVNGDGKRFINETLYGAHIGSEIAENQDGKAWLVLSKNLVKQALAEVSGGKALAFQRDLARLNVWVASKKARTPEALAAKIGLPADALKASIDAYNGGGKDAFGKTAAEVGDMKNGPYYAIDIGIGAPLFPCPVLTLGGLDVDQDSGMVLGDNGPIEGLYAAGRNALGICAANYISGLSIADGLFSGRRAGRHLAGKN